MLLLPALASAHEVVNIESGPFGDTLHIVGDKEKIDDTITITYDPSTDSYILGHDILDLPPGCTALTTGPPYQKVRCPAKGIARILIESGLGADHIDVSGVFAPFVGFPLPNDLVDLTITATDGPKAVDLNAPAVMRQSMPRMLAATHAANITVQLGNGVDKLSGGNAPVTATLGNNNDQVTLGDGNNTITMGNGSDKVTIGNGNNTIKMGRGNSKVTLGNGKNRLTKGRGTSRVIVGTGRDIANFLGGNNFFSGGGRDVVKFRGKLRLRCRRTHRTTSFQSSRKKKETC